MVTTLFAHATRRNAAKCCGYLAILEGHQANAGPGRDMNDEGFAPPPRGEAEPLLPPLKCLQSRRYLKLSRGGGGGAKALGKRMNHCSD